MSGVDKKSLKSFMKDKGMSASAEVEPDETDPNEGSEPNEDESALSDQVVEELFQAFESKDKAKFGSALREFVNDCNKKY